MTQRRIHQLDLFPEVLWALGVILAITWGSAWFAPSGTARSALVAGFFVGGIAALALLFAFIGVSNSRLRASRGQ